MPTNNYHRNICSDAKVFTSYTEQKLINVETETGTQPTYVDVTDKYAGLKASDFSISSKIACGAPLSEVSAIIDNSFSTIDKINNSSKSSE